MPCASCRDDNFSGMGPDRRGVLPESQKPAPKNRYRAPKWRAAAWAAFREGDLRLGRVGRPRGGNRDVLSGRRQNLKRETERRNLVAWMVVCVSQLRQSIQLLRFVRG